MIIFLIDEYMVNDLKLDLNIKYFTWIEKLRKIFMKQHYSVSEIITGLYTANNGHLTFFFTDESLYLARTVDDVFSYIKYHCKYCDLTIIKCFTGACKCAEAVKMINSYMKEIENVAIIESDLRKLDRQEFQSNVTYLKIVYEANELLVKEYNVILETLCACLKLPKASILLQSIVRKYITCKISHGVQDYLRRLEFIACELKPLSTLKIKSLVMEDVELQIPMNYDTKVIL